MRTSLIRGILVVLLALVPLTTLVHRNDLGRWDVQRSAMAAPDEFSYLLMARHFMVGGGLSLQAELGRDTFYPPGYPILLAAWGKCFGLTAFTAHALNALLLCVCTLVVYLFSRRLLLQLAAGSRRFRLSPPAAANLAALITALFATNWHVLETSLLIMSEPAFMLATFAWLALALRWQDWRTHPGKAAAVMALAVVAWSIRGAGIVCVASTFLYPALIWLRNRWARLPVSPVPARRAALSAALLIGLPLLYQATLAALAPEKSLLKSEDSANSYPRQLLHGLIIELDPKLPHSWYQVLFAWLEHLYFLVFGHLNDLAASFVPWPRENPDYHFRVLIGRIFAILALTGFSFHVLRWAFPPRSRQQPGFPVVAPHSGPAGRLRWNYRQPALPAPSPNASGGFLELYVLLYIALYLVWPFNFARFWSPILPMMLVFACYGTAEFLDTVTRLPRIPVAVTPLVLLLLLAVIEDCVQLGNYARRLNYVSDSIAGGAKRIIRVSPDGRSTVVGGLGEDELFALSWYFSQEPGGREKGYRVVAPLPHVAARGGRGEHADEMLLRYADLLQNQPAGTAPPRLFFYSYFPNVDTRDTLSGLAQARPDLTPVKVYQKEIIASVWEIPLKPASTQGSPPSSSAGSPAGN